MSDSESPQHNPDPASGPPPGGPGNGSPQPAGQDPTPPAARPLGPDGVAGPAEPQSSHAGGLGPLSTLAHSRRAVWGAIALVCVAAGVIASLLVAHTVARNDANDARRTFQQSSTAIASTSKLAIQREEELAVSASTFFAANPKATPAEFARWVRWARTLRRFPELDSLGLVTLVRSPELASFETRLTGRKVKQPAAKAGAKPAPALIEGLRIAPASNHGYYCLAAAELVRRASDASPAGLDYCGLSPALLLARDRGLSSYASVVAGHTPELAVQMPVYRGNATPRTAFGRTAASVGWLHEVLVPGILLAQALRGHPASAVRLRYGAPSSNVVFTSGSPPAGAQSATTSLHNGWSVTSFGPPATAGVLSNGDSLALLIGGILLSALLGLVIFLLGAGRAGAPAARARVTPNADPDLYDALTGLPNRALTLDRAERLVARAGRQSGMLAGALFIDIDWFKDVNVKLGEAAGDQLLTIVAERLENVVRGGDTVGRLGGDEFVVLVESAARGVRLDSLARRVIEALHKPVELDGFGPSFFATASIGVAFGRYETPDDLLRDAQLALYAAKAAGKDRYTLFNANMRSVIESRAVLEAELNTALQEKQFFLLYQPIYDLGSRKVIGLEAVIRWRHPKQGVLPPTEFIPLAEETGLIVPIGRWALEEACNRAAAWNVAGHQVGISVKVSEYQLSREGFATDVRRALQQSGVEPSLLTLEIAETTVMGDLAAATARLQEIKQLGVRIAIDDFGGSGYARHSDLQRMPLDVLKVDRNSLAASEDEDYRSWLLEAILIVGRDLSLTVVATGIETHEQMVSLQVMGCTTAQGPFMGKPTPADAVPSLLTGGFPTAPTAPAAPEAPAAPAGSPGQPGQLQ